MAKTVLFVHGLESGPHGRKARYLASAGFTVVSELMPCGRAQVVRDPVVIVGAASVAIALVASALIGGVLGFIGTTVIVAIAFPFAASRLMRRVWRRSVDVQLKALAANPVDVVLGSSFGGAVALELVARGVWKGPTVLLCPAYELVAQRAWRTASTALPEAVSSHLVVVHGRSDETVPVVHSEALVRGSRARLVLVDDDHRLSKTATPDQLAAWIEMATG